MNYIRPVNLEDLDAVEQCAKTAGVGLINLPKKRDVLEKLISSSVSAISSNVTSPGSEDYLFVLTNNEGKICGTCGIYAQVGINHPFYVYRIEHTQNLPESLPPPKENRILYPMCYQAGPSELCALYLLPELRHGGFGKLLSLSRLLFMAIQPQRFSENIVANMRGVAENNQSHFWNGLGGHFVSLAFDQVMNMRGVCEGFLCDILPKHPIYVALLPNETIQVMNKVHPNTEPALKMLLEEGFTYSNEIDPIDGGPILTGRKEDLRTIKNSTIATVKEIIRPPIDSKRHIICNNRLDFRACFASLKNLTEGHVTLTADVAEVLNVRVGDYVRYI